MRAIEIHQHFLSRARWVDTENTIDRIWYGDPQKTVRVVGAGWSACTMNLTAAAGDGCDLFISHEHPFAWPWGVEKAQETEWGRRRIQISDESGMILMNLHDTWDHWPEYGIRESWAAYLGLGPADKVLDYIHPGSESVSTGGSSLGIYRVQPSPVRVHVQRFADRIRELGYTGAVFTGDSSTIIESVAIGVGCHIPTFEAHAAGAGLLVVVYDRAGQLTTRMPLAEVGANVLVVEHSVAETPAMRRLCDYIEDTFPEVTSRFYNEEPKPELF
jgi:putative NIF3 family GTP cyclohydrolase 1 type 2